MMAKVAIRPYRSDDEPWLFGLARSSFGERAEWRDRRALDVLETRLVFVAEVGGWAAGYAALEQRGGAVRIDQLLVAPEHEDEAVEHRLVEYVEGYAISVGASALEVVVESDNREARAFYRARGFAAAGDDLLELILPQR